MRADVFGAVTTVDLVILAFALVMAAWGYRQGLIAGALSLTGFVAGCVVGSRLAPLLLERGARSPYAGWFSLLGALVMGGALASVLELLGFRLRARLGHAVGRLDGLGGAALIACVGLGLAWIAGALAVQAPLTRDLRRDFQRSAILQALNEALPPSGPLLGALARFDPFPSIESPAPNVPPPTGRVVRDPQVRAARRSVVRVLGTACGLGVQGSGWVAGEGVVVTNAHVVAGQDDTTVQIEGRGPRHDAHAIWFDPRNDLAILRSAGVAGVPSLPLEANARVGSPAAVLGFPQNGAYDARPGRLGPTRQVIGQDAYGRGPIRRRVTALRGLVRSGNSGGPVVDGRGRVVTTVFAATVGGGTRGGFGVPDSVVRAALQSAAGPVGTGPCGR